MNSETGHDSPTPTPNPDLASLNRLVGTWDIGGDASGRVTYEWLPGGFFLLQHYCLTLFGHTVEGIEVIGQVGLQCASPLFPPSRGSDSANLARWSPLRARSAQRPRRLAAAAILDS